MPLFALGINHRTAPLAVREQLVFQPTDIGRALHTLLRVPNVSEAAIVSTCNRTEVYCSLTTGATVTPLSEWLAHYHGVTSEHLNAHLYHHPQPAAIRHMFRVASGLDSMVLGEPQILGQMKQAARLAEAAGTLGTTLGKLFQRSFAVAKEVRTTTAIGANIVSMAAAAVHLSGRIFDQRAGLNILFIGAGETGRLALENIKKRGVRDVLISNRTHDRAENLAHDFHGKTVDFSELRAI